MSGCELECGWEDAYEAVGDEEGHAADDDDFFSFKIQDRVGRLNVDCFHRRLNEWLVHESGRHDEVMV